MHAAFELFFFRPGREAWPAFAFFPGVVVSFLWECMHGDAWSPRAVEIHVKICLPQCLQIWV
jgi:hypothetical protein